MAADFDGLGPDLVALIGSLDVPLRSVSTLTTLRAAVVAHAAFRLEFADNRLLKGRRVTSATQAERVEAILAVMDPRHFPRILARRGVGLLEEWRPGTPMETAVPGPDLVRRCGGILGLVHRVPPSGLPVPPTAGPEARLRTAEQQLQTLQALGALSGVAARRTLKFIECSIPADADIGMIHGDFCAENLVCDEVGRPHVIDNETMQIGALDLDLARTWYRWPMTMSTATSFLQGYASHRSPAPYLAHFTFWSLVVLVDATLVRLRAGTAGVPVPLARLLAFLRDPPAPPRWVPT
jgi:hypothetical protein